MTGYVRQQKLSPFKEYCDKQKGSFAMVSTIQILKNTYDTLWSLLTAEGSYVDYCSSISTNILYHMA